MENIEKTADGAEVYVHRLFALADEYIQTQLDGDAEKTTEFFRDMILFVSDRITRPDNADIEALDRLFGAYLRLCTRYRKLPTLECFSWLAKINRTTISTWISGTYRSSTGHSDTAKKWFDICKSFAVDELSNSKSVNPNLIFIAKAAYGMRETTPVPAIEPEKQRVLTADELPRFDDKLEDTDSSEELPEFGDLSDEQ